MSVCEENGTMENCGEISVPSADLDTANNDRPAETIEGNREQDFLNSGNIDENAIGDHIEIMESKPMGAIRSDDDLLRVLSR